MEAIKLESEGWREIPPHADAPKLLVESGGRLRQIEGDGKLVHDFGPVGPVDCPLAVDPVGQTAYRYVSSGELASARDFSEIRAFSLSTGSSRSVCRLPLNQWVLWLLEWVGGAPERGGQLLGLLASDRPVAGQVCIRHDLFALKVARGPVESPPVPQVGRLCRDAYKPLACSLRRQSVLFSGAEGTYEVGLDGRRRTTLLPDATAPAHSAGYHPCGFPQAALGGEGIHLWDLETGDCRQLIRPGRLPVWSPCGKTLYFSGSSASLKSLDPSTGECRTVMAIANDRFPDFWKSRPAQISPCGQYLAVMLSARRLRGVTRKAGGFEEMDKVYQNQNCFCMLHLPSRQFWRIEGRFDAYRWVSY